MQALINIQESLYLPAKAEEVAKMMNADADDDFSYVVVHDPKGTGRSFIRVLDEEGYDIGKL